MDHVEAVEAQTAWTNSTAPARELTSVSASAG
jgi:hypothetical protein